MHKHFEEGIEIMSLQRQNAWPIARGASGDRRSDDLSLRGEIFTSIEISYQIVREVMSHRYVWLAKTSKGRISRNIIKYPDINESPKGAKPSPAAEAQNIKWSPLAYILLEAAELWRALWRAAT